jgi:hypothetical protein
MHISFIGIGAQKCASSWVYDILADHPEVNVPRLKEADFFTYHFENGYRWYEHQFSARAGSTVAGEISPSYMPDSSAPERVRAYAQEMKIVVSLRDPVERAVSQHRHNVRLGRLPGIDVRFETGLATNPMYADQGFYHRHLRRWADHFGLERIHVMLLDDIRADAASVARNLYRFLGVDPDHHSQALGEVSNEGYMPRSRIVEGSVRTLQRGLQAVGAGPAWRMIGDTGLRRLYRLANRNQSNAVIPEPLPETLAKLRAMFADDVGQLSRMLNRDLSKWMP